MAPSIKGEHDPPMTTNGSEGRTMMNESADRLRSGPESGTRSVHPVLAGCLILLGALLTLGAVAASGEYPTGLSTPYAVVLAIAAIVSFGLAVVAFGRPRGEATRSRPSGPAIVAMIAGVASVLVFLGLIGAHLSMNSSPTIPAAGHWIPVVVGGVSVLLGILGVVTAHEDGPSRRMSSAAVLLGLGPAIIAIVLTWRSCYLFVDHARACFGP
jgi:hypothetical protein